MQCDSALQHTQRPVWYRPSMTVCACSEAVQGQPTERWPRPHAARSPAESAVGGGTYEKLTLLPCGLPHLDVGAHETRAVERAAADQLPPQRVRLRPVGCHHLRIRYMPYGQTPALTQVNALLLID
jgi:hypothetical protein